MDRIKFASLEAKTPAQRRREVETRNEQIAYQAGWHSVAYPIEGPRMRDPKLAAEYDRGRQTRLERDKLWAQQ